MIDRDTFDQWWIENWQLASAGDVDFFGTGAKDGANYPPVVGLVGGAGRFPGAEEEPVPDTTNIMNVYNPLAYPAQQVRTISATNIDIVLVIDCSSTGVKLDVRVDFDCKLTAWSLFTDSGLAGDNCYVDVWRDAYANFPPTVDDSMNGGNYPQVVDTANGTSADLSSWTRTTITAGDTLRINVQTRQGAVTRATLVLRATRTS